MIDRHDFEDVRVTTYRSFNLALGEIIQEGDLRLVRPVNPDPTQREHETVPLEWIGRHRSKQDNGSLTRRPRPTILALKEVAVWQSTNAARIARFHNPIA